MELFALGLILLNTLVLLWVSRDTIVSVRKVAEAVARVEETASRTKRITAKILTLGELDERER